MSSFDPGERPKSVQVTAKVYQQTVDLIAMLYTVNDRGKYFLFMEDDFLFCPRGLYAIK